MVDGACTRGELITAAGGIIKDENGHRRRVHWCWIGCVWALVSLGAELSKIDREE